MIEANDQFTIYACSLDVPHKIKMQFLRRTKAHLIKKEQNRFDTWLVGCTQHLDTTIVVSDEKITYKLTGMMNLARPKLSKTN